jgi:hypothetical protein
MRRIMPWMSVRVRTLPNMARIVSRQVRRRVPLDERAVFSGG